MPKGVINTQRMLCSNQQAIAQVWPFLAAQPPVVVDWLPWNHTFGGNHNFNMVLRHGGTLYVDGGKPMPGLIEQTVANLESVAPTLYFNVPRGFDVLLPFLEQDEVLRDRFFSRLDLIFYAGAALPQSLWERLEVLSIAARGERVPMVSAWGSTETAPMITTVHFPLEHAGVIGLPAPGCAVKMVPNGQKQELRIKGPNITPGYWRRPDLTEKAFDDDGWYCIGDAGRLEDPERPERGIVFDGRVAEDFKLLSGTWVHAGVLRVTAIAAGAPVIQDAVVTGHDRQEVGLLVFPNLPGCKALCPEAGDDVEALLRCDAVRERLRAGFNRAFSQQGIRGQATGIGSLVNIHFTDQPVSNARDSLAGIMAGGVVSGLLDRDAGLRVETFESVRLRQPASLVDFDRRLAAVQTLSRLEQAESRAAAAAADDADDEQGSASQAS